MNKTAIWTGVTLVTAAIFMGIYGAWALPDLEQYPVHWDASGAPDRFGSRGEALFNMALMPVTAALTFLLLIFIPKIEPLQGNIQASGKAYALIALAILALFAGIQVLIVSSQLGTSGPAIVNWILAGIALLYIIIGNLLPKFRRNFFIGVRTPWTLSSELSWEKTHRVTGRLFVLSGVLVLLSLPFLGEVSMVVMLVAPSLLITLFALVYSYRVWKADPNKIQK